MQFGTVIKEPGIYPNLTFAEYQQIDAVNWSSLKNILMSPAKFKYHLDNPRPDSDAMGFGRLLHVAVLEPHLLDEQFIIQPETYTASAGKEKPWHNGSNTCKAWYADQMAQGREIVKKDDLEKAMMMAALIRSQKDAAIALDKAQMELTIVWKYTVVDPMTGEEFPPIMCKGRLDAMKQAADTICISDVKTTSKPIGDLGNGFAWEAYKLGYFGAAAWYMDGLARLMPDTMDPDNWSFRYLVVETEPPYTPAIYDLDNNPASFSRPALDHGRCLYKRAMVKLAQCIQANSWPFTDGVFGEANELILPDKMPLEAEGEWR